MTLISSNDPIAIEYNKVKTTIQGIHLLQRNDIYIQGHNIDNNLGEFKQPEVLPLIIENHQRSFEPLKTLILLTMATPAFKQFEIKFYTSITSLTLVIFIYYLNIKIKDVNKPNLKRTRASLILDREELYERSSTVYRSIGIFR